MNRTILVIDDEQATLKMFSLLLEAMGYEPITAANGEEGLAAFKRDRPEIILTDIKMPIMDGIEVLRNIKAISPTAEVIVITGHGDMDLAIKALNLDATDFIDKPVRREALEQALKRAEERIALSHSEESLVRLNHDAQDTTIHIRGNITALSGPILARAFDRACSMDGDIVLRFNENTSINGAGLSFLAEQMSTCVEDGRRVYIAGLSENFRTVFEMVGIFRVAELGEPPRPESNGI